jgi:diguanylate cyclase (GGDEF)-like protein
VSEFHDVTEAKRQGERLRTLSEHDALTGLPNRLLVLDRLHLAMAHARRNGSQLAVCYLDLDGFKAVNDRFGHQAGDRVLVEAARRLTAAVRASDTVGRLGGDEFAILLPGVVASGEFDLILGRILAAIRQPYSLDDRVVDGVGASIGFTVFPDDETTPQTLLAHADQTMYRAKHAGKNRYRRFGADGPSWPVTTATP